MPLLAERKPAVRAGWSIRALLEAVREELRRRRVYRTTLRQLRRLSQRDLDDLGIARGMISRLAAEAAWGKKN